MEKRYEINHDGMIVLHESALCSDLDNMINSLLISMAGHPRLRKKVAHVEEFY